LTRERVCRLQLLLVLASAVILGSKSREARDHILLSQIRNSPNLEDQFLVFISPRNRVAKLYPQALLAVAVPRHIVSARTAQKTPIASAVVLLHACLLRPSHDRY
jgi:hypothetical protein